MPSIKLVTEIPGPASRALHARRQAAVPRGIYQASSIYVRSAHGVVVEDVDGNRLLDFAGGIGTLNVGHTDAGVVQAVQRQAADLTHMCFSVAGYETYVALAERLARLTPGTFAKKTMFVNSGAEAVENAVKIARVATGRPAVVAFDHAFHGRTNLTMALTAKVAPYKDGFGPFAPEVYRSALDLEALKNVFKQDVGPEQVACVVLEPVQGEGGFIPMPSDFPARLQELCARHGILYVDDEV
jgi:4-aminobutyrate aminotransferase/(S)-3-amino-2-methylpropionate transaminase